VIGLDFEAIGLEPERGKLRLVQTANGNGGVVSDAWDPKVDLDRLLAVLSTKKMVSHNANFEEAWLREHGIEAYLEDTLVMSRVLHGGTNGFQGVGHKLEDLALRELGIESSTKSSKPPIGRPPSSRRSSSSTPSGTQRWPWPSTSTSLRALLRGLAEADTRGVHQERHPDRRGRRDRDTPQVLRHLRGLRAAQGSRARYLKRQSMKLNHPRGVCFQA
jgi:hypothetical protein